MTKFEKVGVINRYNYMPYLSPYYISDYNRLVGILHEITNRPHNRIKVEIYNTMKNKKEVRVKENKFDNIENRFTKTAENIKPYIRPFYYSEYGNISTEINKVTTYVTHKVRQVINTKATNKNTLTL